MATGIISGQMFGAAFVVTTQDAAAVAANTTAEQNFTVPGLQIGDMVFVSPPSSLNAGLGICGTRVDAANTLTVRFNNNTAGSLNPASAVYTLLVFRPEAVPTMTGVSM